MSKDYEHTISNEIEEATPNHIRSYRCGYSGNSKHPQPDVLVTDVHLNYALEVKGPIQSDALYVEEDDLEQLVECTNEYTVGCLVVKFSHREPLVVRHFEELSGGQLTVDGAAEYNDLSVAEQFAVLVPGAFDPRVTDGGRLALSKPTTDEWPSATAGSSDVDAVLSGLGVRTEKSVDVV